MELGPTTVDSEPGRSSCSLLMGLEDDMLSPGSPQRDGLGVDADGLLNGVGGQGLHPRPAGAPVGFAELDPAPAKVRTSKVAPTDRDARSESSSGASKSAFSQLRNAMVMGLKSEISSFKLLRRLLLLVTLLLISMSLATSKISSNLISQSGAGVEMTADTCELMIQQQVRVLHFNAPWFLFVFSGPECCC